MKIYLETSVISNSISENNEKMKNATVKLLNLVKMGIHEGFVSDLVYEEIMNAKIEKRKKLIVVLRKLKPRILKKDNSSSSLAIKYITAKIIPKRYATDALHIAIAVTNSLDVIVSWNLRHIVREKTIYGVNQINKKEGYRSVLIKTPKDVIE